MQPDAQARRALGACRAHIVGAELIEHGAAHEPDEQRQHDGGQRHRGQEQMLEPIEREQPGLPDPEPHRLAAPEGRKPPEPHREDRIRMMPVRNTGTEMPSTLSPRMNLAPKDRGFTAQ